ncbi:MAG: hypothetical protein K6B14_06855 [Lachnospiraceae bacterium]|nr:hypothetical protein [Lachnospiraceae bacterium]
MDELDIKALFETINDGFTQIKTDLSDFRVETNNRFDRMENRLDRIELDLADIKSDMAEIKVILHDNEKDHERYEETRNDVIELKEYRSRSQKKN